jgi:hypothetical protein
MVGSIDRPRAYFFGRIPMRWSSFQDSGAYGESHRTGLVYSAGTTGGVRIGLGGSERHMLGARQPTRLFPQPLQHRTCSGPWRGGCLKSILTERRYIQAPLDVRTALLVVERAVQEMQGPECLEFVARKLLWHESNLPVVIPVFSLAHPCMWLSATNTVMVVGEQHKNQTIRIHQSADHHDQAATQASTPPSKYACHDVAPLSPEEVLWGVWRPLGSVI